MPASFRNRARTEPVLNPVQLRELQAELESELRRNQHPGRRALLVNALARIRDGNYGTCHDCRRAIPFDRLSAIPETTICIDCSWARHIQRGR